MEADMDVSELHEQEVATERQEDAGDRGDEGRERGGEEGDNKDGDEDEELIEKAQKLMDKITSSVENPNPDVLHALSNLLEAHESKYLAENDPSSANGRASHNIGKLCNLVRENDEFFELISSTFLSENRYSTAVQAASTRLLLNCSITWMYPHVFDEAVSENFKNWVMDDTVKFPGEDSGRREASDSEMLKTYSTGLLALSLASDGEIVEDVLTSGGLSAKLMHYLRIRVIGETSTSRKDPPHSLEARNASLKSKDEGRSRVRKLLDSTHADDARMVDARVPIDQAAERDQDGNVGPPPEGEEFSDGDERSNLSEIRDGKAKLGDLDEGGRDDPARRRMNRSKSRARGRINEGAVENEQILTSPGSGCRQGKGRAVKERCLPKSSDVKKSADGGKCSGSTNAGAVDMERRKDDECYQGCIIGSKDISDLVKKAVEAAEAEARAANASADAVKAAGDAAAELVKTAASEELKASNNEDAAVLAASTAASTVIDAANTIEVSRNSKSVTLEPEVPKTVKTEGIDDVEECSIPDTEFLAQLQEKYCIQCLEILGEYVEVLGPVLHEKGVDVCIMLLQRSSRSEGALKVSSLLPDVMKLICALAAHKKFAAMFVDRGGIQKLLAVPRLNETFFGLSSCLYTIGSLQGIMERVCALPSDVILKIVELAIQLLECSQDQARKNAALFFAATFVFKAILDAFDAQDGLQKFLGLLNDAASVRTGANSGAVGSSNSTSLRNDRSAPDVLTSSEKQMAFHTCVALRQYFRAHLLLLVDSIRPSKGNRSGIRNTPSVRAAYKPLDISNEAVDAVFLQLQKDRKLGPAFVRTQWPAMNYFLASSGHITMLELCQTPPVDRYLHDLVQYAFGVLHVVTCVPAGRKAIVNATLTNNRAGVAVILDAANTANSIVDPEIIQPGLNVLINLVCPPPSISNKPPLHAQNQQTVSCQPTNIPATEARNAERSIPDRGDSTPGMQPANAPATPTVSSGLVGDRRISLGAGTGSAGLAAQLEQVYRQAREAVRANNGIKILLNLLQPRIYVTPPASLDCLRALTCRVLLGLARDDTIAQILTKLQVGKRLSELIRDSGGQTGGTEQGRWQAELAQVALELIAIVTSSGRATALTATDAATPTLRRIERAAIAAATPITYHSQELLLLIHEHLQASGLAESASTLLKEAQLAPLPSLAPPSSITYNSSSQDFPLTSQPQWPSGRVHGGFFFGKTKAATRDEDPTLKCDTVMSGKKRSMVFSPNLYLQSRNQSAVRDSQPPDSANANTLEVPTESASKTDPDAESQFKTPISLPRKRKLSDLKDVGLPLSGKRINTGEQGLRSPACPTPSSFRRSTLHANGSGFLTPASTVDANQFGSSRMGQTTPSSHLRVVNDPLPSNSERLTLDSIMVQYLKHQHRQCPAPITTLPPLSLLHPHVCPEPKRALEAPLNVTGRLGTRELHSFYGGVHGNRRDRQFIYSRFRPWRTCRDDVGALLTCISFLGESHIAVGSHTGELKIFDSNNNNVLESCASHQSPVTLVQSYYSGDVQLLLSSSSLDVKLWDASSISGGPLHTLDGCKAAKFSNSGEVFAALSTEAQREILLYDVHTCRLDIKLSDTSASSTGRSHAYSLVHFSPSDSMLLWNGVLWDRRGPNPVHRFDQFSDYGGGGFHPSGNEVIINSEVWDLRKFRLLRSVPSLDQTTITFNARGDVIYAVLRRNLDDVMSAVQTRRVKHPLFSAFRTLDAVNYSDIATFPVDRCVLDFAAEPTDSFVGLITMDDQDEMFSSARVYEIGRRRPTDDDSDPDDADSEEDEEDEEDDDDDDLEPLLGPGGDGSDSGDDGMSDDEDDDDSASDLDDEERDLLRDGGAGLLEFFTELDEDEDDDDDGGDEDDDSQLLGSMSSGDEDFVGNIYGF